MSDVITVKYKTRKDYCHCCDQYIKNAKTSDFKEFDFCKEKIMEWQDWTEFKEYKEDVEEIVSEYAYETISFFATSSDEKVFIDKSQLSKLINFVLGQVSA